MRCWQGDPPRVLACVDRLARCDGRRALLGPTAYAEPYASESPPDPDCVIVAAPCSPRRQRVKRFRRPESERRPDREDPPPFDSSGSVEPYGIQAFQTDSLASTHFLAASSAVMLLLVM